MIFDSYHGAPRDGETGPRMHSVLPTEVIGVACERCGRAAVYGHESFRGFRLDMPVRWLTDALIPFCQAKKTKTGTCEVRIAHPDDGCSDIG